MLQVRDKKRLGNPYTHQCYMNTRVSKDYRSAWKFPWLCICHCVHLSVCDKNLDLKHPLFFVCLFFKKKKKRKEIAVCVKQSKSRSNYKNKSSLIFYCLGVKAKDSWFWSILIWYFIFIGQWPLSVDIDPHSNFPELKRKHKWKSSEDDECSPSLRYTRKVSFVVKALQKGVKTQAFIPNSTSDLCTCWFWRTNL